MASILPTQEQFENLNAISNEGPLVMLNLLRFKKDGGEALYERYSQLTMKILNSIGAKIIYYGHDVMAFIGDDQWDAILLVEYPSRSAFVKMITDEEYLEASRYRTQGLEDSRLYVTRPRWVAWDEI